MKRAIWNRNKLISLVISLYLLLRTYWSYAGGFERTNVFDVLYLITLPLGLSGFIPFACLFPVLPFGMSFAAEYESGYFRYLMIRDKRNGYIWNKIWRVAVSGGCMMTLAMGAVYLYAVIFGIPTMADNLTDVYLSTVWASVATVWGGKLVLLLKLILAFLFGMLWGNICLLFTVIYPNRYIAFVGTLILFQGLWNLLDSLCWNPIYLLAGDFPYGALWIPYSIALLYVAVVVMLNRILMGRRLSDV